MPWGAVGPGPVGRGDRGAPLPRQPHRQPPHRRRRRVLPPGRQGPIPPSPLAPRHSVAHSPTHKEISACHLSNIFPFPDPQIRGFYYLCRAAQETNTYPLLTVPTQTPIDNPTSPALIPPHHSPPSLPRHPSPPLSHPPLTPTPSLPPDPPPPSGELGAADGREPGEPEAALHPPHPQRRPHLHPPRPLARRPPPPATPWDGSAEGGMDPARRRDPTLCGVGRPPVHPQGWLAVDWLGSIQNGEGTPP